MFVAGLVGRQVGKGLIPKCSQVLQPLQLSAILFLPRTPWPDDWRNCVVVHTLLQVVARVVAEEVRRLQPILRQRQKQQQRLEQQQRRAAEHLAGKKGVLSKMGGKGGTRSART